MTIKPDLIAIDWGTSNFRAFLLNQQGDILETRFAKQGLLNVPYGDFSFALQNQVGDCLEENPDLPIIMSGMVGSRQGWQEVPYLLAPLDLNDLAAGLQTIGQHTRWWIVPGLRINYPDGRVDVMRGEETQILGAMQPDHPATQIFCLPGTHSKWARIEQGKLVSFSTFMTGEIFTLLMKHSILGKPVNRPQTDMNSFIRGLTWSERNDPLLSQLFQIRTQLLANTLQPYAIASFLSGILIGYEVRSMLMSFTPDQPVTIVANNRIAQFYVMACKHYQRQGIAVDVAQVTARGLYKIAQRIGVI